MSLIPGRLQREPRHLDPVECSMCGDAPREWFGENAQQWIVMCMHCYPLVLGTYIKSAESRNDAVRTWNRIHGDLEGDKDERTSMG